MKAIFYVFTLFISFGISAASAASLYFSPYGLGEDAHPFNPAGSYCTGYKCGYYQMGSFTMLEPAESLPADTNDYFYFETGMIEETSGLEFFEAVFRGYAAGERFKVLQDIDFTVSWGTQNILSGSFLFDGEFTNIAEYPSGSFDVSMNAGDIFHTGIYGTSSARDAYVFFEFNVIPEPVEISEVPLPASLFLFAPALLGFMGLRRKTKLS